MDPAFREHVGILRTHRYLVDVSLIDMVNRLRAGGVGHGLVSKALAYVATNRYLRRKKAWYCAAFRHQHDFKKPARFGDFSSRHGYGGRVLSGPMLKGLWMADAKRRTPLSYAFLSTVTGKVLKLDHTFWSTKHVREAGHQLFEAQLGIANEIGQIVGTVFTPSKSLNDVEVLFRKIKLRYSAWGKEIRGPQFIYTDNPEVDRGFFMGNATHEGIFPETCLSVSTDPFHLLLNYTSQITNSPKHKRFKQKMRKELSEAIFVKEATDDWLDDQNHRRKFDEWMEKMSTVLDNDDSWWVGICARHAHYVANHRHW